MDVELIHMAELKLKKFAIVIQKNNLIFFQYRKEPFMKSNNLLSFFYNAILNKPGDNMSARVTDSGRQVLKISTDNGTAKYSATRYPNGTIVETKTTKLK